MPPGLNSEDIYHSTIWPAITETGLRAIRHGDLALASLAGSGVWEGLRNSDLVIADVSGKNPNVFYELGITSAIQKPTILISTDLNDVPSDLAHFRLILYKTDQRSLKKLRNNLTDTIRRMISTSPDYIADVSLDQIKQKIDQTTTVDRIRTMLERAEREISQEEYDKAANSLQEVASSQIISSDLSGLTKTLILLGIVRQATGQFDAALSSLQQAIDISKRMGDHRSQAAAAGNLANILSSTGDFARATLFYR
jgi:tetratricopeptide (TPR) repeat protein